MIKTILFDLDGTLLPIDTELFTRRYFKALSVKLKDHFTSEELVKGIWTSTNCMINNLNPNMTNEEVFFEDFYKDIDGKTEVLNSLFYDFYENDFDNLKEGIVKEEYVVKSIELLKQKGYNLVVATNPLFPKVAILQRIKWAGLNVKDFKFITNFEEMHYCKPQIEFYKEILKKIDENPANCMMVGNDVIEDMRVKELAMNTYLIEDYIIGDFEDNKNIDYRGKYKDFYEFCKGLPTHSNMGNVWIFSWLYIVRGEVELVEDEKEKIKAMDLICKKYTPAKMEYFSTAIEFGLKRVNVYKVEIVDITAKRKKYDLAGKEMKWGRME